MALPLPRSLSDFTQQFLASWNASVGNPAGAVIPSSDPIVAIAASNAGAALYLQSLIYSLVSYSRASTSTGPDLDSWLADFGPGAARAQGSPAIVNLQFTVNLSASPTNTVSIPQGTLVQTQPIVVPPNTVPATYQVAISQQQSPASSGTYTYAAQAPSPITIAGVPGYAVYNNIPANQFTQLVSPIAGVTAVTNPAAPTGGTNQTPDAQARADFVTYITSLAKSNQTGIWAGIEEAFGGLVPNQTFVTLTNASNPTLVQPGQIWAVFVSANYSGTQSSPKQYTGLVYDPQAQAILNSMVSFKALGLIPFVYYANQYAVSGGYITATYSASALAASGLSISALDQLCVGAIQGLLPATGGNLGQALPFSQMARALLDISVTLSTGTVTGIITDVNLTGTDAIYFNTNGGFFSGPSNDSIQPGTPTALDPLGYLTIPSTVSLMHWTTPSP